MSTPRLAPFVNQQRVIAFALMMVECVVVGMFARTIVFPAVMLGASVIGVATRWRVEFNRQRTFHLAVILWLVMLAQYGLLPANPRYNELFSGQQVAYLLAQYLMSVQAASFFVARRDNLLPTSFVLLGTGALACLAIVQLRRNHEPLVLQALQATFVIGALLFWSSSRRLSTDTTRWLSSRTLGSGLVALVIVSSGCGLAWLMARYEAQLDRWVMTLLDFEKPTTDVGFAETSRLGAVRFHQSQNANQIALRVISDSEPGYFRGKVYDSYFDHEWHLAPSRLPVQRMVSIPANVPARADDGLLFNVGTIGDQPLQAMTVRPGSGLSGIYFAPLEASYLQLPRGSVTRDQHNVLHSDERATSGPYKLFVAAAHRPSENATATKLAPELDDLLFVPRSIREDERVLALRDELFRNAPSTHEKIAAVVRHFGSYRYSLTVTPPPDRDPVGWFLSDKPDAHCEYFGSGTVMLLRLAGVPSRYVTGFVVDEQNSISREFVARQKDAHAWAEARLDDGRWELIETTPEGGLPSQNGPSETSPLWEAISALWEQWQQDITARGIETVLRELLLPIVKLIVIGGVFGACVVGLRRYQRARRHRPQPLYTSHALTAELLRHDRLLNGHFRPRAPHETLSQYATALETAAASQDANADHFDLQAAALWYRAYEQQRFQATSPEIAT